MFNLVHLPSLNFSNLPAMLLFALFCVEECGLIPAMSVRSKSSEVHGFLCKLFLLNLLTKEMAFSGKKIW